MAMNAVSGAGFFAPLLGNFPVTSQTPGTGAARIVPGLSDRPASALHLTGSAASFRLLETLSPQSAQLRRAVSGVLDRVWNLRSAATDLAQTVSQQSRFGNQLNADTLASSLNDLISAANDLRDYIQRNPQALNTGLLQTMDSATSSERLKADLLNIGVQTDANGVFSLNEATLRAAVQAQPDEVATTLGLASGFAQREVQTAGSILNRPTIAVIGYHNLPTPDTFVLTETQRGQWERALTGQFVDMRL